MLLQISKFPGILEIWKKLEIWTKLPEFALTAQNLNCEARFEPKTDDRSAREKKQEFLTSSVLPHTQYESHLAEGGVVVRSELNKLVE